MEHLRNTMIGVCYGLAFGLVWILLLWLDRQISF